MLYRLCRPLLFLMPPETAHCATVRVLSFLDVPARWLSNIKRDRGKGHECLGLTFSNRVGLAAGFDKDGECLNALSLLGFGFVEVGTVTPKPQPGNRKPRLFRDTRGRYVVNRLGFPNRGADALAKRLSKRRRVGVCGVNIGKNYRTPLKRASADYLYCYERVFPHADYVALNVSSPNTPDLRDLQRADHLLPILSALKERRDALRGRFERDVPILVKPAPDLDSGQFEAIATLARDGLFDGAVATNTTIWRPSDSALRDEEGGLSGSPLLRLSLKSVRKLRRLLPEGFPIIGVGGVMNPDDAISMLDAGADLVQIYTGLVFEGPSLARRIRRTLRREMSS